ncbi:hypothetical protein [Virgibacillus siamensis]|uniref:hypothetical protein n=1 Tax=Virgibacillus siamensis TaxID=480071 RepID=UPI000985A830|nr:hypothetical protein [Virgibacillus siamensis]
MKLIPANKAPKKELARFLEMNENVDGKLLVDKGYAVEVNEKIEGCFVLDAVENDIYWLKQLYITKSAAAKLPVLLEGILTLAKKKQARKVYVHSHQPMVDILLEALQFHPQAGSEWVNKYPIEKGNWWTYNVS